MPETAITKPETGTGHEFLNGCVELSQSTLNDEKRTVDIVFFTGIDVPRRSFWDDEPFILRFDPKGADLSLLNNGAGVFDNHQTFEGSSSQKGVVEKAWKDGRLWKATTRFSKRKSVDELWQDIKDRIVTKFSMGVEILEEERFAEDGADGKKVSIRLAKKWRPFELSVAPIPADFGTTTLAHMAASLREQLGQQPNKGEQTMVDNPTTGTVAQQPPQQPPAPPAATAGGQQDQPDRETLQRQAKAAERKRQTEIRQSIEMARKTGVTLEQSFIDEHLNGETSAEAFDRMILERMAERSEQNPTRTVHVTRDEAQTRRELMGAVITSMIHTKADPAAEDNPYRGLSVLRIAEESVRRQHNLSYIPPKSKVVELAMQETSDFANVLENSARKALIGRYGYADPTYRAWAARTTTPDFKTMSRAALSEVPALIAVPEGAQITIGTRSDRKEQYALGTFGRGTSYTMQMLINDDLSAFTREIEQFGIQTARLENSTVYAILTANAALSDSVALFHATHGNLGSGVIGDTALDAGFTSMRKQTGMDGVTVLNIVPRFLIVPAGKEWTARRVLLPTNAGVQASAQSLFSGRLEVIGDAELDGTSTIEWYLAADPALAAAVEYAHLEGQEGPQFIRKENEQGILGIQFYCYTHFGAKAIDHRPIFKSSGL